MDRIFGLPAPIVFAHRGGAGEVPESTELAFRHAIDVGAAVLELDLCLTRDGKIVVWHGPKLDNVYIGKTSLGRRRIRCVEWSALAKARVVHSSHPDDGEGRDRKLLLFEEFVNLVERIEKEREQQAPSIPWNVEIKGYCGWRCAFPKLVRMLDEQVGHRKIVLASTFLCGARRLRRAVKKFSKTPDAYTYNLALQEQLPYRKLFHVSGCRLERAVRRGALWLGNLTYWRRSPPRRFAFQTSHAVVTRELVQRVHQEHGEVHPFLTKMMFFPGVEDAGDEQLRPAVHALLDAGVDGIMTDYPARVVRLVSEWMTLHPSK